MNILRRLLVVIAHTLLPVALLAFGALFSINQALGSPTRLQTTLQKSGIYDTLAANIVKQATSQNDAALDASGQQAVQRAVSSAIPPSYLQQQTNGVIQGIYDWLQGKSPQLKFSIDLSTVKTQLVNSLADQAGQRAASLPACTPQELASLNTSNIDPFGLTCLPPGVTASQVATIARQQAESSDAFKNSTINQDTLKQNGKSLQDQLKPVATGYKAVKYGALAAIIASILLIAAIILLSRPWQRGVKHVSVTLLSVGVTSAGLALLGGWLLKMATTKLSDQQNAEVQTRIVTVITNLTNDLRNWWVGYGLVLVGLGITGFVLARFIKVTHEEQEDARKSLAEPVSALAQQPLAQKNDSKDEPRKDHGQKPPTAIAN